jgi:hypothetical protein
MEFWNIIWNFVSFSIIFLDGFKNKFTIYLIMKYIKYIEKS